MKNVETKLLMTIHFHEDQVASAAALADDLQQHPSNPRSDPTLLGVGQFVDEMKDDPTYIEFCNSLEFPVEELLAGTQGGATFDDYSMDSAYFSASSSNVTPFLDATSVPGFLG